MNIEPLEARIAPAVLGLGSVTATLPLTETTDSPTAIVDSTFQSASSLGNIIGTVNGVRTSSGNGQFFGGIGNGVKMFAGTTIGDIMGLCNAGAARSLGVSLTGLANKP
jgi:hypothetical protein